MRKTVIVLGSLSSSFFSYREKPQDDEWLALRGQKLPLLLNYSQCKLLMEDYYPVIEHCTEALEIDPGRMLIHHVHAHGGCSLFFHLALFVLNSR